MTDDDIVAKTFSIDLIEKWLERINEVNGDDSELQDRINCLIMFVAQYLVCRDKKVDKDDS